MHIQLDDLLTKLGVPEVSEKHRIRWHYLDATDPKFGGFADVRLETGGKYLVVDLKHWKKTRNDDFIDETPRLETFHLMAERVQDNTYKIRDVSYDGKKYDSTERPMIELGFSMFHARAVEINERMIAGHFDKGLKSPFDAVKAALDETEILRPAFKKPYEDSKGVVVSFPRRTPAISA